MSYRQWLRRYTADCRDSLGARPKCVGSCPPDDLPVDLTVRSAGWYCVRSNIHAHAVLPLVERCNDYSVWPYSRMSLARPVGWSHPVLPSPTTRAYFLLHVPAVVSIDPAPLTQSSRIEFDPNAIRAAILEAVSRQLEEERQAHARTKEESDAEILRLRAMVARRDAELEACATHAGHRVLLSTSYPADSSLGSSRPCPACAHTLRAVMEDVSAGPSRPRRDEQFQDTEPVLSQTLIQQRTLEREVEYLRHQVSSKIIVFLSVLTSMAAP